MFEKYHIAIESMEHLLLLSVFSSPWTSSKQTMLCVPPTRSWTWVNQGSMLLSQITINVVAYYNRYLLFGSFQGARVYAWLNLVFCSGSHQAAVNLSIRVGVSSEAQGPLPSSLVVGRIQFLGAVELVATCLFEARRKISLFRKG